MSHPGEPLSQARGLPPRAYTDPAAYASEVERMFRREWISVARVDQVARPGDYVCVDLFDEPLVVTRAADGAIRVLSRVCRHRGMLVASGSGHRQSLQCPYHAWTYGLD